jgi:RNA polymerase sigma-70 factor (ECF subfamily)
MSGVRDTVHDTFHDDLTALLPKLRIHAAALVRSKADRDDLVQEAVVKALAGRGSFQPGTNFAAWVHRILRNAFISGYRRKRETVDIADVPSGLLARGGNAEDNVVMGELRHGLTRLSAEQREALIMVSVSGMSYDEVAEATGCAVGTAKCRVFRARRQLEKQLLGKEHEAPQVPHVRAKVEPAFTPEWNADESGVSSANRPRALRREVRVGMRLRAEPAALMPGETKGSQGAAPVS